MLGEPSSETMTSITFVLGPCASSDVHEKTPLLALIVAFEGAPAFRLKVSPFAGMSASDAEFVNVSKTASVTVTFEIVVNDGAEFTSFTIAVNDWVALKLGEPLSVTMTLMSFVLGPCASDGVQLNTPFVGLIVAPAGEFPRLNARV